MCFENSWTLAIFAQAKQCSIKRNDDTLGISMKTDRSTLLKSFIVPKAQVTTATSISALKTGITNVLTALLYELFSSTKERYNFNAASNFSFDSTLLVVFGQSILKIKISINQKC